MNLNSRKKFQFFPILLLIIFLPLFQSCEPTRDRRLARLATSTPTSSNNQDQSSSPSNTSNNSRNTGSGDNQETSSTNGNQSQSLPTEFSHCKFSTTDYGHYHSLVGDFNICLSNDGSNKKVLFQAKNSITNHRLCLFPTNDDSGNGSVMIGSAKCFFVSKEKLETISLSIDREEFTNRTISGIMMVKDMPYGEVTPYHSNMTSNPPTYVTAYEDCMIFLYNTGDNFACLRFKNKGNYIYVTF